MKRKNNAPVEFELPNTVGELDELCAQLWDAAAEAEGEVKADLILKYNMAAGAGNRLAGAERMKIITKETKLVKEVVNEKNKKLSKAEKQKALKKGSSAIDDLPFTDVPAPPPQRAEVALSAYVPPEAIEVDEETKKEPIHVGSEITFAFAGSKVTGKVYELTDMDTFKVNGNDGLKYHVLPEHVMLHGETPVQYYGRVGKKKEGDTIEMKVAKAAAKVKLPTQKKEAKPVKVTRTDYVVMRKTKPIEVILKKDVPGAVIIREVWDLVGADKFDILDFEMMSSISKDRIIGCLKKYVKNFNPKKHMAE